MAAGISHAAGARRLLAVKKLGWEKVPVTPIDLEAHPILGEEHAAAGAEEVELEPLEFG